MTQSASTPSDTSDTTLDYRQEAVAKILLSIGAVSINVAEPFTYSSGIKSPIYCDNRLIMSYPPERRAIVRYLAGLLEEKAGQDGFDVVAGVATSGVPFASWVADYFDKPMVYVRESTKEHGKRQQIEGLLKPGSRVVVIEDLVTTGSSALATVGALRAGGGVVDHCAVIFSYESGAARKAFQEAGVRLLALCGISTLLAVATSSKKITPEERAEVAAWLHTFSPR